MKEMVKAHPTNLLAEISPGLQTQEECNTHFMGRSLLTLSEGKNSSI